MFHRISLIYINYAGIALKLSVSLHNQGILEQEMITLVHLAPDDPDIQLAQKAAALKRANSLKNQRAKIEVMGDEMFAKEIRCMRMYRSCAILPCMHKLKYLLRDMSCE